MARKELSQGGSAEFDLARIIFIPCHLARQVVFLYYTTSLSTRESYQWEN